MKTVIQLLVLATCFFAVACNTTKSSNTEAPAKRKLVWSDEFNYTGLPDTSKWSYDTGGHGWGNNEKQFYTEKNLENASVKDGMLNITAVKKIFEGSDYTSARLVSRNKGDWKYGRFEIKAKMPKGRGLWPAIWMLPTYSEYGDWPVSGEIDIMEHVGYLPDSIFGTVHTGAFNHRIGTQKGKSIFFNDLSDVFHVYSLDWDEKQVNIYVDEQLLFSYPNPQKTYQEWPFDQRFHLLLNMAVGGDWGGSRGIDETIFPQTMQVDYVRVYE